jgi:hypothetical protein
MDKIINELENALEIQAVKVYLAIIMCIVIQIKFRLHYRQPSAALKSSRHSEKVTDGTATVHSCAERVNGDL